MTRAVGSEAPTAHRDERSDAPAGGRLSAGDCAADKRNEQQDC